MKNDINGCSTCPPGAEQYEHFTISTAAGMERRLQYDYRTDSGQLFSCVAVDLEAARAKRDAWLNKTKGE